VRTRLTGSGSTVTPVALTLASFGITLALTLLCVCVSRPALSVGTWPLAVLLALSATAWILGAAMSLRWYPLVTVLDVVFAAALGQVTGRAIPARFRPFLVFLIILSVLDTLQVGLSTHFHDTSQGSSLSTDQFYSTVVVKLPMGNYRLGPFDLTVAAAIGAHWLRRGAELKVPLAGVAAAMTGAYAILLSGPLTLPLIPLFLAGWLGSEVWYRRQAAPRALPVLPGSAAADSTQGPRNTWRAGTG
jgi:small basic protein